MSDAEEYKDFIQIVSEEQSGAKATTGERRLRRIQCESWKTKELKRRLEHEADPGEHAELFKILCEAKELFLAFLAFLFFLAFLIDFSDIPADE